MRERNLDHGEVEVDAECLFRVKFPLNFQVLVLGPTFGPPSGTLYYFCFLSVQRM